MTELKDTFIKMMLGQLSDAEMEEVLLSTEITAQNVIAAREGILEVSKDNLPSISNELRERTIDVCGTGGDGLNTLNISTAVAFVLAGCGIKVAKHGNKGVSSKSGSSDVLQELGINVLSDNYLDALQDDECNICFLFAPKFYPAMKNVAPVRAKLGRRTIFNVLGPLLNPLKVKHQIIGVYDKALIEPLSEAFSDKLFIHSEDGMDEASIFADTHTSKGLKNTKIEGHELKEIIGGNAKHNSTELEKLLKGKGDNEAYKQMVILNAQIAINYMGLNKSAKESLESGKAYRSLEKLRQICT